MSLFFSGREILDMALRIEANGQAFYQAALGRVKHPSVKAAYEHLAAEEGKHTRDFTALLSSLSPAEVPSRPEAEYENYLRALIDSRIFTDEAGARTRALRAEDDTEAVELGMRMEKDTILFFSEVRDLVRREDQPVLERILNQEREHLKRLAILKQELSRLKEGR